MTVHDGQPSQSWPTELKLHEGEDWMVPCDRPPKPGFNDWVADKHNQFTSSELRAMDMAWAASRTRHTAKLRRIGWLDQKGRVWLEVPPAAQFDGGSLTPLLIDARD